MNRGAYELGQQLGPDLTQEAMAIALGPPATAKEISAWLRRANSKPKPPMRERIHEVYGISPDAWDQEILPATGVIQPMPELGSATPYETAVALSNQVRQLMKLTAEDPTLRPDQRLDRLQQCSDILAKVGKLTGATILNERQIMASPVWAAIWEVIILAISKEPNGDRILAAVATALDGMKARDA